MDYTHLAGELLEIHANLIQVPAARQVSKMVKGELFVLNYLMTHEKIVHPKELSEKMAVTTARIASLLNHMEEKQLVERCPDPEDNRQIIVRLTDAGRDAIRKARMEALRLVTAMLEDLGEEDARNYIRIQKKIWSRQHQ